MQDEEKKLELVANDNTKKIFFYLAHAPHTQPINTSPAINLFIYAFEKTE